MVGIVSTVARGRTRGKLAEGGENAPWLLAELALAARPAGASSGSGPAHIPDCIPFFRSKWPAGTSQACDDPRVSHLKGEVLGRTAAL